MRTIKVTQSASQKVAPDTAVLRLRLFCEHKKHAEAVKGLAEKRTQVLTQLAGVHLESNEVTTTGKAVDVFVRDGKKVFRAHADIRIELPIEDERFMAALDAVEGSEAELRQSYELKDESVRAALLKRAVTTAHAAAETIAEASGVKVGKLQSVDYTSYGERPHLMRAMADTAISPEPESIELTETVTCEWEAE